jgi:polar amino acid transport system substrate-binding protein
MIGGLRSLKDRPRRWWLVVTLVMVLVMGVGLWIIFRSLREEEDKTWERILRTGVLPICTDPSWPPFEFYGGDTGQIVGFDRDLADLLAQGFSASVGTQSVGAESVGADSVRVQIVTVAFDSLYDALLSGRCDVVLSALPYESFRTQDVAYSMAYFNAGLVLVVREDTTEIQGLPDLEDRVVGVEWGFVAEGDARQMRLLRTLGLRRYTTPADALRAVHSGEVDVALVDHISALEYLRECEGLQIAADPITHVDYVMPVRPDSHRLLGEIDRLLLEMRGDGTLSMLEDRWF